MFIKADFICVFLLCFTKIEGSANGYRYYSNLQAKLKLHRDPADFQTARIKCHDEGKQILSRDSQDTVDLTRCVIYNSNGTRELVNCQLPFAYVCHAPVTYMTLECEGSDYELNSDTGSCYKFHKDCKPWDEAYTTCQDEGAHLAIINSNAEAKALMNIFAKYPRNVLNTNTDWEVAVGFYYWKEADTYITIEGNTIEEAGYAKWDPSNPSQRGYNSFGGGMFRNGLLDDIDKSLKIPFICEKKPVQRKTNYMLEENTEEFRFV